MSLYPKQLKDLNTRRLLFSPASSKYFNTLSPKCIDFPTSKHLPPGAQKKYKPGLLQNIFLILLEVS